jgi:serine/threonine protein kinase
MTDQADAAIDEEIQAAKSRIGQTLGGKWRLDALIGVGGMAAVYSATHKNNLKNVAVKVLHAELQRHETVRTRFLREGYVANKVGHAGAVSAIDDGIDEDGSVYLVMELLSGKSLAQRLDEAGGKLSPREVLGITDGLLDVLAAAHLQNVVHRDLKPDNVFLTEDGGVKVLDFGVARVLDARGEAKTRTGVVMGTPEYMPQEQARGRSELIDGRTDLWAVGAIVWRLLSGRYVHVADTQNEVLLLAMTEPAKPLSEIMPGVSPKIAEIVDRALAFEPKDRYPDAESMRAAVKEALAALDEQDGKATLAGGATAAEIAKVSSPSAPDDDVDDAAKTIPVSDFARQKTTPATGEVHSDMILGRATAASEPGASDSSPRAPMTSKPNLWVHTKATPPEPPKEPKKRRPLLPIALGVVVLAGAGVGAAYMWPRWHGDSPVASSSSSGANVVAGPTAEDPDADVDGGEDDQEAEEEDASTVTPPTTNAARPAAPNPGVHPATHVRPHTKKKKHR